MTISDPTEIFLQPKCCADPAYGRTWCEGDAPVDCEDGVPWTKYVRADVVEWQLRVAELAVYKRAYAYLQERLQSIGYNEWAKDYDDAIDAARKEKP